MPAASRHVILIVVHGVAAADLDLYPEWRDGAEPVEMPNLRTAARLGLRVVDCAGAPERNVAAGMRRLLGLKGGGPTLLERAARERALVLTWLPTAETAWLAEEDAGGGRRWDVTVPEIAAGSGLAWDDLLRARPRVRLHGEAAADEVRSHLEERVLARFPGAATMQRHDWEGVNPRIAADHWCGWLGDAFLRALWFAFARADGRTFAVMSHPGPAGLRAAFGQEGYRHALEHVDEFIGRLMLLREHESAAGMLIAVTGDFAADDASNRVPAVVFGPGIPEQAVRPQARIDDLSAVLAAALG